MRYGLMAVVPFSEIYHATYNPIVKLMDMALVHSMGGYFAFYAFYHCDVWTWRVHLLFASFVYAMIAYWALRLSDCSDFYHACLHIVAGLTSYVFLSEHHCWAKSVNK